MCAKCGEFTPEQIKTMEEVTKRAARVDADNIRAGYGYLETLEDTMDKMADSVGFGDLTPRERKMAAVFVDVIGRHFELQLEVAIGSFAHLMAVTKNLMDDEVMSGTVTIH